MPRTPIPAAGGAMAAPLSTLFRDPFVARAFRRAERDSGQAFAVPADKPTPKLAGGAMANPEPAEAARGQ